MGFLGALLDFYRTMGYTSAMTDPNKQLFRALKCLLSWCEDNFVGETWLDADDTTDGPDGTWKSYGDIPQWETAYNIVQKIQKDN